MNGEYRIGDIVFGNWTLVRLLGEGSYGKVYEAHREDFGTIYTAAIKVMTIPQSQSEVKSARAEGMDEESVTAYFRSLVSDVVQEFALMSRLKGITNIVSYEDHAVVEHKGEIGWDILIRMELLTPMLNYMEQHPMTRNDVIKLGIDMCKALELCQRYNIIHRDIKPENIFISDTGDYKLGDFGVARKLERTTGGLSKKGTYTYMAPEIYRDEKYGSTVDIYSLGIVLYRLLNNNRAPFLPQPPQPITHSDRERALVRRFSGEPLPPPVNAEGRLAEIVLKACSFDPKDRYSSPLQMRQELEAIQYKRGEDAAIYGGSAQIDVDSSAYTHRGSTPDDDKTVYTGKKPALEEMTSDNEKTVYTGKIPEALENTPDDDEKTVFVGKKPAASVEEKKAPKKKKTGLIAGIAVAVVALAVVLIFVLPERGSEGQPASTMPAGMMPTSTAETAAVQTTPCPSATIAETIRSYQQFLAASDYQTAALRPDGTVEVIVNENKGQAAVFTWKDIGGVAAGEYWTFGIKNDGTVLVSPNESATMEQRGMISAVGKWTDIVKIACAGGVYGNVIGDSTVMNTTYHTVGLRADGTVVAAGTEVDGACDVSAWTDIVDIAAGFRHTAGLRADGTAVAVGDNEVGQCDLSSWTDVVQISAGKYCTVGLRADGKLLFAGKSNSPLGIDVDKIGSWKNIVYIYADFEKGWDDDYILAMDKNGKVYCSGANHEYATAYISDCRMCVGSSWGYAAWINSAGEVVACAAENSDVKWNERIGTPIMTGVTIPDRAIQTHPAARIQTAEEPVPSPEPTPIPLHLCVDNRTENAALEIRASGEREIEFLLRDLHLAENDSSTDSFWLLRLMFAHESLGDYYIPGYYLELYCPDTVRVNKELRATLLPKDVNTKLSSTGLEYYNAFLSYVERDGNLFMGRITLPEDAQYPADAFLEATVYFFDDWTLSFNEETDINSFRNSYTPQG